MATVTYIYQREMYSFNITDRTYLDNSSTANGIYPYGTQITIKAVNRDGYTFRWSDNETNYERTFIISSATNLTSIYTANTNTPYKVKHYKMDLDGENYTLDTTQNLQGTTDSPIIPAVNSYTGFTSPQTQSTTINGDESTIVKYYYTRNKYLLTIEDSEYVVEDKTGLHYYEEEVSLTAKDREGYTFAGWSTGEETKTIIITMSAEAKTVKPLYTRDEVTITLDPNGGTISQNQITKYKGQQIGILPIPTKSEYEFVNWYTDLNFNEVVDSSYVVTEDITIHAKWEKFPLVFSESGECTFNGKNGVITGDNCGYANGINKYIDTGIDLYNLENHDKDYEIGFTIVSYNPSNQENQATFMNTKLESDGYPGLVFRRFNKTDRLDISSRRNSTTNSLLYIDYDKVEKVKIYRIYNKTTETQEIYYSLNDEEKIKLNDLSEFNPIFDLNVWFGASATADTPPIAQRILVGTLKDMYIKLGTYQSDDSNKYTITYNANGGRVISSSKKIKIGDEIGILPTPTSPSGKSFKGWYTGLTDGEKITKNYIPNNNMTIYARYYNDISGATINPSSLSLIKGNEKTINITNIDEPVSFISNDLNVATVDESTGLVKGINIGETTITLTGTLSQKTRTIDVTVESNIKTVSFDTDGGSSIDSQEIEYGQKATRPVNNPTKDGYIFDDWYTDDTYQTLFDFNTVINEDTIIYGKFVSDEYVASIGNNYYTSLVNAINAVQTNQTKTTIRILKDIEETSVSTLKAKTDVILDLQNFTITNSNSSILKNNGEIYIKNGTLVCGAGSGALDNNKNAVMTIDNVTINSIGTRQAAYNKGGDLTIKGGSKLSTTTTSQRAALQNLNDGSTIGKLKILSAIITSPNNSALQIDSGEVTIGVEDQMYDISSIVLQGSTYGVTSSVNYSIYDGIFKGKNAAVNNEDLITNIEEDSEKN